MISGSKPKRRDFSSMPFSTSRAKDFVADFHVGEIQIGEHVGKQCQHAIAHRVPKKEHPVRAAAGETSAVDHIGQPFFNRLDQRRIILRIIFEIGILNQHDFPGHMAERGFQRRALALILLAGKKP